ncbi:hypothetical protein OO17_04545 [Rhodopseudomonas palustris]|uniref:DUF2865 domain-containing protein n=2 Tax=Nitrobacteraceae TaxID=41294 RepID=A0A0D7F3N9_RHOPL|nr:hypothetical protein OO17_04545 [Rhodopseudomonas palustris]
MSGITRLRRGIALFAAIAIVAPMALAPRTAAAENFFEALFGLNQPPQQQRQTPQGNFFADPFGLNQQAAPPPAPRQAASGGGPAFCVRSCDGRYFPLQARGGMTPAQMCQAFCPAGNARVFFGSSIAGARASNGERYADSENAFAYRKALKADCTCNGRDPAGLASIDLARDTSLRRGDVVATADGLVAYSGVRLGADQTPEFTPVASYPGLTAELRARLGEMKVAPVNADLSAEEARLPGAGRDVSLPITSLAKPMPTGKRADIY